MDAIVYPQDLDDYTSGDPQTLIGQATAAVRSYCGWHVTPVITETINLDASGGPTQMLPSLRVVDVSAVVYDGTPLSVGDYTWREGGVLRLDDRGSSLLSHVWRWSLKPRSVEVTMTHGYADAADLAGVILARVSRLGGNPEGLTRKTVGPFTDQYESGTGFTDHEQAVLDRYKLPPRP